MRSAQSGMNIPAISLLLPTRGRSELVIRLFKSIINTVNSLNNIEIILYVDDDDHNSHHLHSDVIHVIKIIGPSKSMGDYNRICFERSRGHIILLANDDMMMRTPGWDARLIELDNRFPDKVYLGYGDDLLKRKGLCTFPILSRRTCELLVEPYPSAYQGAFIDVHLFDIFKRLQHAGLDRTCYLNDVIFEHMHFRAGKAPADATYLRRGRFIDDPTFISLANTRSRAAQRLIDTIQGKSPVPFQSQHVIIQTPRQLSAAIIYFAKQFLFDHGLPFCWRWFLWCWFAGRLLAARGLLRPFVR
ncbi:glycosyltransferase family A protein [Chitinivorax sp. B]|uniref:glycosyltransferase family A protein n=1 Tax=Chitinivorax sp. B TaxID=2502235 RepID=UPI0010F7FECD|nr:glycosyltransferase family A protein [Chitinivorax sp. B]